MSAIFDFGYQYNKLESLKNAAEELRGMRSQAINFPEGVDLEQLYAASELRIFLSPNEIICLICDAEAEMEGIFWSFVKSPSQEVTELN